MTTRSARLAAYFNVLRRKVTSPVHGRSFNLAYQNAGWGLLVSFFRFSTSLNNLVVYDLDRGLIPIEKTAQFKLARDLMHSDSAGPGALAYEAYVSKHNGEKYELIRSSVNRMQSLMAACVAGAEFSIFVAWHPEMEKFVVRDGFHRLACLAASRLHEEVHCQLVV